MFNLSNEIMTKSNEILHGRDWEAIMLSWSDNPQDPKPSNTDGAYWFEDELCKEEYFADVKEWVQRQNPEHKQGDAIVSVTTDFMPRRTWYNIILKSTERWEDALGKYEDVKYYATADMKRANAMMFMYSAEVIHLGIEHQPKNN